MGKRKVTLNLDELTMGDMEAFEEATGLKLGDEVTPKVVIDSKTGMPVKDPDDDKGRPLMRVNMSQRAHNGLIYLGLLRDEPTLTFDEFRKSRVRDIEFELLTGDPSPLDENEPTSDGPD